MPCHRIQPVLFTCRTLGRALRACVTVYKRIFVGLVGRDRTIFSRRRFAREPASRIQARIPHSHGLTRSYSTSMSGVDGDPSDLSEQAHSEEPVEGSVWSVALSVMVTKRFHTGEYQLTSRCTQFVGRYWPPTDCARSSSPIGARLLVDVLLALRPLPRASAITSRQPRHEASLDSLIINRISTLGRHYNPPLCQLLPHTISYPRHRPTLSH